MPKETADYFIKEGSKYCLYVHSHHRLAEIFVRLWEHLAPRGSFLDLLFRLIFFHQSLLGAKDFPPMTSLT